jgi:hypothetical protein
MTIKLFLIMIVCILYFSTEINKERNGKVSQWIGTYFQSKEIQFIFEREKITGDILFSITPSDMKTGMGISDFQY